MLPAIKCNHVHSIIYYRNQKTKNRYIEACTAPFQGEPPFSGECLAENTSSYEKKSIKFVSIESIMTIIH